MERRKKRKKRKGRRKEQDFSKKKIPASGAGRKGGLRISGVRNTGSVSAQCTATLTAGHVKPVTRDPARDSEAKKTMEKRMIRENACIQRFLAWGGREEDGLYTGWLISTGIRA